MIEREVYDPAHEGDLEAVRAWLQKNPGELNSEISDGYSLLHIASAFGHETMVAFLLGRHALVNLNANNQSEATPLHLAVAYREEDVANRITQMLVANGAELNAKQRGGQTALHHAVGRGSELLTETLILAGGDPFIKDDQGRAATDVAKQGEYSAEPLLQLLKKAHSLTQAAR